MQILEHVQLRSESRRNGKNVRLKSVGVRPAQADQARLASTDRRVRILNFTIALIAIVLLLPLMALIAVAIKLTSPGPVIYTQTRVGLDRRNGNRSPNSGKRRVDYGGRLFKIYKFRTMVVGADASGEVWASPNDPRVTRIGRILRQYRLDELPQLFNVLKGDMNLVGPRPEQPNIFVELRSRIRGYQERQRVLPGITGLAQVSRPYDTSLDDVKRKLELDLEYIRRRSVLTNLGIMLRTVPVILFRQGAW
mgnify:CR=1 FL=1